VKSVLEELVSNSKRLQPASKTNYLQAIRSFVEFAGSDPKAWTVETVEAWRDQLKVKPQTANVYVKWLKNTVNRWARRSSEAFDFAKPVEYLKVKNPPQKQALTIAEARDLVATCSTSSLVDVRDRAILVFGFRTGMRGGGLLSMTHEGIDRRTHQVAYVDKGGAELVLPPIDDEAWFCLDAWLQRYRTPRGPVFPLTPIGLWKSMKTRADKVGIAHRFSPHIMRHSFITWCRELGIPDHVIMLYTGHVPTGGRSQLNTYTSTLFSHRDTPIQRIPSLL
jgi:integrase